MGARLRGDDGQVSTALVMLGCLLLLALALQAVRPLVTATDQRSRTQTAADAAALAGADLALAEILTGLDDGLAGEDRFFDLLATGLGRSAAAEFADRNGADLVSYEFDWVDDEVRVEVASADALEGGQRSRAQATASLGLALGRCVWSPRPTPPPDPAPAADPVPAAGPPPDPAAPAPDPPDLDLDLWCGGTRLTFRLLGATGRIRLAPPGQLESVLEPRLTA